MQYSGSFKEPGVFNNFIRDIAQTQMTSPYPIKPLGNSLKYFKEIAGVGDEVDSITSFQSIFLYLFFSTRI